MNELPVSLYRPEQVRELDRLVIDEHGVPGFDLMQHAGRAAYRTLRRRWPEARRLAVICGGGNNGGDGYVVARRAHDDGLDVQVMALKPPAELSGDARRAAEAWLQAGETRDFDPAVLGEAEVIVDALLGTGLDRPVTGRYAETIEAVNASGRPVLAVDIPSGVSGATGNVLGVAVRAAVTPTFIGLKQGLFTGDAPAHTGEIVFDGLDAPDWVYHRVPVSARRLDPGWVRERLAPRPRTAHKGHYGHVLVAGGDSGMGGAVRMAAEAAGRLGAGLVSAATRPEHVAAVLAGRPEVMCRGVAAAEDLKPLLARAGIVALGPGLGRSDWSRSLFRRCIAFEGPLVVDADGLNLLAEAPFRREDWVLTPHPGEASRLLGKATAEIQKDRFAAVEALHRRYGGIAVLKGAGTLIQGGGPPWVCDRGNPGMASGGMGDVLTGIIAGLLAQGLAPGDAAAVGVWLHAAAADRVAATDGERGMLATDLFPALRRLANP